MSTRGTYLIAASLEINHSVCFYVHSDSYPEGAANYFLQMHYCKNPRGHYADRFFRANIKAEFSSSHAHDFNSDVEYCYTLNAQGQLIVLHRPTSDRSHWLNIYKGAWYEFVNQQLSDKENLYLFKTAEGKDVMTLTEAKNRIDTERVLAKKALAEDAKNKAKFSGQEIISHARFHENEAKLFQI